MPPTTTIPPAADHHHHHPAARKHKKLELKFTLHSVKSHISAHHCAWLSITVLLQLLILLFLNRPSSPSAAPLPLLLDKKSCKHGLVYVYDLPPSLNQDLISNCDHLDQWTSLCNAVSNGGFGPPATNLQSLIPPDLSPAWYWTDMYISELIYHTRITHHKCRTLNPSKATAFYIPFYAGLAVRKHLWSSTSKSRDHHAEIMSTWLQTQNPFKKSNGSDHFIMLGRLTWEFRRLTDNDDDWGTKLLYMPVMKNILRLGVERSPWDPLEISVPYPTAFHPRSESDIRKWQSFIRARTRPSLFTFVGATRNKIRNDFRGVLMGYCKNESLSSSSSCRVVDCSDKLMTECYDGAPAILEAFLGSDFCLQPKGDGYTRRSAYDCMLAGSIPVYFWKGSFEGQYEWHLPGEKSRYSVFIDRDEVRNDTSVIKRVLEGYTREEVRRMRETIIDFLPRMLYSRFGLSTIDDAFDVSVDKVLQRFKQQKIHDHQFV